MEEMYFVQAFVRNEQNERVIEPVIMGFGSDDDSYFETYVVLPYGEKSGEDE